MIVPPPYIPEDVVPEEVYQSFIPEEGKEGSEFYEYERLIMSTLVRYGEKVMCNMTTEEGEEAPVTVIEYVINDLKQDELNFHDPLHRKILSEARMHLKDNNFICERYFIAHPDPLISKLAAELSSDRDQLSKYHTKGQHIVTDDERLHELVPSLMTSFKNAIIEEELKHIMYALQDPENSKSEEKYTAIIKRYMDVQRIRDIMAKRLGDRVILRK
jgi:hypothetical protein